MAAATVVIVYAAYECGLAKGTSVRLSIAPTTTSQEIVFLVVEQLAKVIPALFDSSGAQLHCFKRVAPCLNNN